MVFLHFSTTTSGSSTGSSTSSSPGHGGAGFTRHVKLYSDKHVQSNLKREEEYDQQYGGR